MTAQLIELDGQRVSLKGEMVSLTGLWKAAGSDPSKKPAKWRELPSTEEFVSYLADYIIRKSDNNIFDAAAGRNGQTFAHWQIAMNYARYLDPAFAVRCNDIVRAHMEKKLSPTADFPSELVEIIRRTDGIVRMLAKKVTKIEHVLDGNSAPASAASFTITTENAKSPASAPTLPSHGSNIPRRK